MVTTHSLVSISYYSFYPEIHSCAIFHFKTKVEGFLLTRWSKFQPCYS